MGVSRTGDYIKIKIKIENSSQEPAASSKALGQELEDMDVLCTFKIKLENQNLEHGCIKDRQFNFKMPNSNQEPPASSKAPNQDLNDMDALCTSKI